MRSGAHQPNDVRTWTSFFVKTILILGFCGVPLSVLWYGYLKPALVVAVTPTSANIFDAEWSVKNAGLLPLKMTSLRATLVEATLAPGVLLTKVPLELSTGPGAGVPPGDHPRILQAGDLYIARLSLDLSQPWQRVKVCIVVHYTYLFLVSRVYEQGFVAENVPPLSAWRPHPCQPSVR